MRFPECGFDLLGFKGQRDVESARFCVEISEDNSFGEEMIMAVR